MSILDRLNLLVRSELSDLRRRDGSDAFSEMESSLRDAKRQQIALRRSEKKLIAQIRAARAKADQWEERAVLALKSGEEELAREALIVKNKAVDEAERLREELREQRAYLKDISSALEALELKISGSRNRIASERGRSSRGSGNLREPSGWDAEMKRRLQARGEPSEDFRDPTSSSSSSSGSSRDFDPADEEFGAEKHFREFDRMSSKIDRMSADIDAVDELAGDDWIDPRRRELEDIFSRMEKKKRTDDDLSDLKDKFK